MKTMHYVHYFNKMVSKLCDDAGMADHGYVSWYIFYLKITDVIIDRDDERRLYRDLAIKNQQF